MIVFSGKIEIQQKKKVNRMRWITWGSVAASLMIVVTFAILWRQGSSEREQYLMKTLASPDRSGVQLQLSDGKTISLAKVLEVKEIDGRNVATNDTAGNCLSKYAGGYIAGGRDYI